MKTIHKVKLNLEENTLKQIRQALGLSQTKFADRIGATKQSIIRWENGQTKPLLSLSQVKNLGKILEEVGLTIYDLPDDLN